MNNVVYPKYHRNVPTMIGMLTAPLTMFAGTVFEDIEIVCGECGTKFIKHFKRDDTRHAKCPACNSVNSW